MNRERVQMAIDALEELAAIEPKQRPVNFSLSLWFSKREGLTQGKPNPSCGTVACAMGYLASLPKFNELGLELLFDTSNKLDGEPFLVGRGVTGFAAAAEFFGIQDVTAVYLFSPDNYSYSALRNPLTPVRRLKKLLDLDEGHEFFEFCFADGGEP